MKKLFVLLITTLLVLTSCQKTTTQQETPVEKETSIIKVNYDLKIGGNRSSFKLVDKQVVVEQGATVDPKNYIISGAWDSLEVPTLDTTKVGKQDLVFSVTKGDKTESYTLAVEVVEKKQAELPNTATTTTTQTTETTTTTAETSEPVAQVEASEPTYEPEPAPSPQPEPTPAPQPEPAPVVEEPAPIVEAPAPVVEAPYRLTEIGNSGMEFDTFEKANQYGWDTMKNERREDGWSKYRAYLAYTIMWSDGSQTYSVDFTLNE